MKIIVINETFGMLDYLKNNLSMKSDIISSFEENKLVVPVWYNTDNEISDIILEIATLSYKYGRTIKNVKVKEI